MDLEILGNEFKIIKLNINDTIPDIIFKQDFFSITKTDEEVSIVVDKDVEIKSNIIENNWKAIKIVGTLDFSLIGILSRISRILAQSEISIFVISTYNTDYILFKSDKLEKAIIALKDNGYNFIENDI